MRRMSVVQLESGQTGVVISIKGGRGLLARLEALGIRVGVRVRKMTGQLLKGPVTVQVGGTQLAIGFGMAARIIVEVDE
ncbi:MAG: ferrous iron transport protein A [bacterium]